MLDIEDAQRYDFYETGMLGERIPLTVHNITLSGDCRPCEVSREGHAAITFPKGNYTLSFSGPVCENHLLATFEVPRTVHVRIPPVFDIRNPALGMITPGGVLSAGDDGGVTVTWNATRTAEVRFYDRGREDLLYLFANIWIIIAVVMLLPFLLTRKKKE